VYDPEKIVGPSALEKAFKSAVVLDIDRFVLDMSARRDSSSTSRQTADVVFRGQNRQNLGSDPSGSTGYQQTRPISSAQRARLNRWRILNLRLCRAV
jgi:hypothetical protein